MVPDSTWQSIAGSLGQPGCPRALSYAGHPPKPILLACLGPHRQAARDPLSPPWGKEVSDIADKWQAENNRRAKVYSSGTPPPSMPLGRVHRSMSFPGFTEDLIGRSAQPTPIQEHILFLPSAWMARPGSPDKGLFDSQCVYTRCGPTPWKEPTTSRQVCTLPGRVRERGALPVPGSSSLATSSASGTWR